MSRIHVVCEGDHLPAIAAAHGFGNPATIWNHPENADLKKQRDPCVLNPGDAVYIPDKLPRILSVATGARHKIFVERPTIKLRIVLKNHSGKPRGNVSCTLLLSGDAFVLTSDANGLVEHDIPVSTKLCHLKVGDETIPLRVGYLVPVDQRAGWRARLENLGYAPGPSDSDADPRLRAAVEEFQCDEGLEVTGNADAVTQTKLREAHGS